MRKKVTIKDVAGLTGVSAATVSLVLNGKGDNIPECTRQRIRTAAEKLDYSPDYTARSLVTGKTQTIGVIIPDISNMFFAETVRHIQLELNKYEYDIILCNSEEQMRNDVKYIRWLASRKVDGLILAMSAESMEPQNRGEIQSTLDGLKVPYIFLDRYYKSFAPKVMVDNVDGGYRVAEFLMDCGHTEIGVITGPVSLNSSSNRLKGFTAALNQRGIPLPEENIVYGRYDLESGRNGAEILLNRGVTAVFTFNDLQAYGVLAYAHEKGVKVPDDISLVGFDDIFYSSILETKLTTVRQPVKQMALEVCNMMVGLLAGKPCSEEVKLKTKLIVRDSVKDIKAQ